MLETEYTKTKLVDVTGVIVNGRTVVLSAGDVYEYTDPDFEGVFIMILGFIDVWNRDKFAGTTLVLAEIDGDEVTTYTTSAFAQMVELKELRFRNRHAVRSEL